MKRLLFGLVVAVVAGNVVTAQPPKREKPAMTADERSKLQKELITARDRQASKARGGAKRAQSIKP